MWSSSGEKQNCSKTLKSVSSSSSSSTSISSPPPFSVYQNSRAKSMEEVWKDINLSSLQDKPNTDTFQGMIFQDFLAPPFGKDPHQTTPIGGGSSPAPLPPPPATKLTLNSGSDFHLFGSSSPLRQNPLLQPRVISNAASLSMQFDGMGSCPGMNVHGNGKKRCSEPENSSNSGDRRHKRMIKNRESAARSRARKQAYTSELELVVDQLTKENARLREQQRQLCVAPADQQLPRKHSLHRTSTAPF